MRFISLSFHTDSDKLLQEKLASIRKNIIIADNEVKLGLKVGSYIPEDVSCHTNTACDFARYACETIKKKYELDYCEYTTASAEDFARKQYVINNIDKALEQGYIKVFYQPGKRIQGYLFGRPMPKEEVIEKIRNGTFSIKK